MLLWMRSVTYESKVGGLASLQICRQKCIEIRANMMPKSIENHEQPIKKQPKWCPGAYRKRSKQKFDTRTSKSERPGCFSWAVWGYLSDLGRFFPPLKNPTGRPKRLKQFNTAIFWRAGATERRPKVVLEGAWRRPENSIGS